ncbi:MAG: DivIVA domain-containing protein [Bacillota bacterium]|nr:DivIVA domain-containing protein [Bacillota bacterium]
MLTPLDIETKELKSKFGKYKKEEIDDFLKAVAADYKELYMERIALKDKIVALTEAVNRYKSMEDIMQSSIMVAQSTGEEVKRVANDKAKNIVEEAEIRANSIMVDAQQKVSRIDMEMSNMKIQLSSYRKQMEQILRNALDMVEAMPQPGKILERTPRVKCSDDTLAFVNPIISEDDKDTVRFETVQKTGKVGFEDNTEKRDREFVEQQTMRIPVVGEEDK